MKQTEKGIIPEDSEMKTKNFFLIMFAVVLIDQISKFIIRQYMNTGESIPLIKNILHLTYVKNTGSLFGMLQDSNIVLLFLTLIVVGGILFYYDKIKEQYKPFTVMILGGAVGNVIDRIFFSHVVDFIDFRIWPVFNIADSCITIGVIILVIYLLKEKD